MFKDITEVRESADQSDLAFEDKFSKKSSGIPGKDGSKLLCLLQCVIIQSFMQLQHLRKLLYKQQYSNLNII